MQPRGFVLKGCDVARRSALKRVSSAAALSASSQRSGAKRSGWQPRTRRRRWSPREGAGLQRRRGRGETERLFERGVEVRRAARIASQQPVRQRARAGDAADRLVPRRGLEDVNDGSRPLAGLPCVQAPEGLGKADVADYVEGCVRDCRGGGGVLLLVGFS